MRAPVVRGEHHEHRPREYTVLSADRRYRYFLERTIGPGPVATFIMLNPSTADAEVDDPTIRKCLGFCKQWGCGRLHVVNLFALRTSRPQDLKTGVEPVGPENSAQFVRAILGRRQSREHRRQTGPLVCAWGVHGGYLGRDREVMDWIRNFSLTMPTCLGLTKDGHPRHPLYVAYSAQLMPYAMGHHQPHAVDHAGDCASAERSLSTLTG
jgi:hypothetical protein